MLDLRNFLCVALLGCAPVAVAQSTEAVDLDTALGTDKLAAQVADRRVVLIGETHVRYDHHLNQLALLRALYERHPVMAIGLEYFPRAVQAHLDDFVEKRIDEQEMLRATDYFGNWGYDYRLYAPILRFAREHEIPLVALNVPREIPSAVVKVGIDGLTPEQRALAPKEIEPADEAYRGRLKKEYDAHGSAAPGSLDHFVEAQLVWDEGMAESAAMFLEAHPEMPMAVLAGSGHLMFGSGIPMRLARRTGASYAIVLNNEDGLTAAMADFVMLGEEQELPAAGILGVRMHDGDGECSISGLVRGSAGAKAGLKKGDVLVSVDGVEVHRSDDVKLALWDKAPGDRVQVVVVRKHFLGSEQKPFDVELKAAR